jgi:hypothetical protein
VDVVHVGEPGVDHVRGVSHRGLGLAWLWMIQTDTLSLQISEWVRGRTEEVKM